MFKSYWKVAWRNILRHKTFTVINVLGLALGICFCLIIFLVASFEFGFDRFHPDGDRIYHLGSKETFSDFATWNASRVVSPLPDAIRREIPGVEAVTGFYDGWEPKVKVPDKTVKSGYQEFAEPQRSSWAETLIVDPEYFSVFPYKWLAGNAASLRQPFQVALSVSRARKYFGDVPAASVIGKDLVFDDTLHLTVAGVVADWTEHTDFATQEFVSKATISRTGMRDSYLLDQWTPHGRHPSAWVFVKLAKGVKPQEFAGLLEGLVKRNTASEDGISKMLVQPLSDVHFNEDYSHDDIRKAHKPTLYGVMALAVFILLIAVINFINLSTAQSIQRAREVGVRKVLGSGRMGLTVQFLAETLLVVLFSVVLATCLVVPFLQLFSHFIPTGVHFQLTASILGFLVGLTLLTTLLAGYYPARVLSSYLPVTSLRGGAEYQGKGGWSLRRGLIVFQFTISLAFIIGTLVVSSQVRYVLNTDYGLKSDAVVTVYTNWRDSARLLQVFQNKLSQLPEIEALTRESDAPIGWGHMSMPFVYEREGKEPVPISEVNAGDESFVPFYHMRIVAGRNLHHSDSLQEVLVNETAARSFGFPNPGQAVGRFVHFKRKPGDKLLPIVGVVADYHTSSFRDPIHSVVIGHIPEAEIGFGIRLATAGKGAGDMEKSLKAIREAFKSVYPHENIDYLFMDASIRFLYEEEMNLSMLVRSAMLVTIFISCMGLFGVSLFAAEKRTKEIGIRKVLGASVSNIVLLLGREFLGLVTLSILIASPIAWWAMNRWLDGFAYRIHLSLPLFLVAGLCGLLIALLTVSFQSVRAARANPVDTLKTE